MSHLKLVVPGPIAPPSPEPRPPMVPDEKLESLADYHRLAVRLAREVVADQGHIMTFEQFLRHRGY